MRTACKAIKYTAIGLAVITIVVIWPTLLVGAAAYLAVIAAAEW